MESQGVERRLATILAADVGGYSRLVGDGEVGTRAALKAYRKELFEPKLLPKYHGRIVKLLSDGLLMEFASVMNAVAFAGKVQCVKRERNADVPEVMQIPNVLA